MAPRIPSVALALVLGIASLLPAGRLNAAPEAAPETSPGRVAPGQAAPDFALPASDGSVLRLSEAGDRKRLVLVFFRGAW